jgi:MIP family channel proteins
MTLLSKVIIAMATLLVIARDFKVHGFSLDSKKTSSNGHLTTVFRSGGVGQKESPFSQHSLPHKKHLCSTDIKLASPGRSSTIQLWGGANGDVSPSKPLLMREMIAEFIGTFLIVQIGCGTVCAAVFKAAQVGLWQIAVAWSIAVSLGICTTASVSGAHLNPAVTFSLAIFRKFPWKKVFPFVMAQVGGAVAGAGVNLALFWDSILQFETANNIVRGSLGSVQSASAFGEYWSVSSWLSAFFAEAFGSAILAFAIFALTHPRNETTSKHPFLIPPMIGATVAGLISVIAPLTQAGFNPARDFGPRIVAYLAGWGGIAMKGWWLYVLAPLVGAPIGAWVADRLLYNSDE